MKKTTFFSDLEKSLGLNYNEACQSTLCLFNLQFRFTKLNIFSLGIFGAVSDLQLTEKCPTLKRGV